jgi:hypothetical protein
MTDTHVIDVSVCPLIRRISSFVTIPSSLSFQVMNYIPPLPFDNDANTRFFKENRVLHHHRWTPWALTSKKAWPQFDVEQALPRVEEISHLKLPDEFLAFFTQWLHSSQASKILYTLDDKYLSYHDIRSATERDMIALDGSLGKTAESLLIAMQELCLLRACNEVWLGTTLLKNMKQDIDDTTKTSVEMINLLKNFWHGPPGGWGWAILWHFVCMPPQFRTRNPSDLSLEFSI